MMAKGRGNYEKGGGISEGEALLGDRDRSNPPNESFDMKHEDGPCILTSVANRGKNTAGSHQFLLPLAMYHI